MRFSWPDVLETPLKRRECLSWIYFPSQQAVDAALVKGKRITVLVVLMDSTGELVLGGGRMWFLLRVMALPRA